jgi:glycosyltransferase involved in cell wall biosynthesis
VRITEQVWPEGTVPVVSIKCITYQHVNFIRDAIEGFLMQETTFPVEILIHDDASTDGTADIVRQYQAKYPQLIRTVLQTVNQHSQGTKFAKFLNPLLRGEFIALCEGDDYWTSSQKLQRQVEVLDADRYAVGAFHQAEMRGRDGEFLDFVSPTSNASVLSFEDIVLVNNRATCSMLYRSKSRSSESLSWAKSLPMGDWPLQVELAASGYWRFLDENMAVYRKHGGGLWSGAGEAKVQEGTLRFYDAAVDRFGLCASNLVNQKRKELLAWLINDAVRRDDWRKARGYLFKYWVTPPRRFTVPSWQKRNSVKILRSVFRAG